MKAESGRKARRAITIICMASSCCEAHRANTAPYVFFDPKRWIYCPFLLSSKRFGRSCLIQSIETLARASCLVMGELYPVFEPSPRPSLLPDTLPRRRTFPGGKHGRKEATVMSFKRSLADAIWGLILEYFRGRSGDGLM